MPDLSHLTPEEREIIESVVHRQKQEEQKEQEIMRLVRLRARCARWQWLHIIVSTYLRNDIKYADKIIVKQK